jgi:hypothetical protein
LYKSTTRVRLWQCERWICLTTMQCHIYVKSSKGSKSKCHWIGSLLKWHKKKISQQIAVIPLVTMKVVLPVINKFDYFKHIKFK